MNFSQAQLRVHEPIALRIATLEDAYRLWRNENWPWYDLARKSLINALLEGRLKELSASQLAYINFTADYLRAYFGARMSDEDVFRAEPDKEILDDLHGIIFLRK